MQTLFHPMAQVLALRSIVLAQCALATVLSAGTQAATAQSLERLYAEPPLAAITRNRPTLSEAVPPSAAAALSAIVGNGGEAQLNFTIQYTDANIYNPGTDQYDAVHLRSYRTTQETIPPKIPFVAPTIEIFPGETVRITLKNGLQQDPACHPESDPDTPACINFNRTNLHSHGLWVSPAANSDNVLLSINPGVTFQYEYNIPADHPAGTFWYHPHRHGSTALQVASGMAGVLIVKGTRLPTPEARGDIDTLLKGTNGGPFRERLVLLQQIQYACRDASGQIKVKKNDKGDVIAWICDPGDVGGIEGYDQFGPGSWQQSTRYTSINGEVLPTFADAQVGQVERWRVVHAGVRDTVKLQFRKMRPGAEPYARLSAGPQQQDWISRNCPGELLPQFGFASDGFTRAQIVERPTTTLQPGYREDMLIVFPEAGNYCIVDAEAPAAGTVNSQAKSRQFLGTVAVAAGPAVPDPRAYIAAQLTSAADRTMPPDVRQKVRDDLSDGLKLTSFVPHPTVTDAEVTGQQFLELKISLAGGPVFLADGRPYDPNRIDRTLALGGVDEWTLTAGTNPPVGHPFHIHVNPFQIVKILDPKGADVSVDGEPDDTQYANLKGVWRDTVFVKPGYRVVMRTRYQRYIGEYVLHCHILDHENQGMMENVRIALPDGSGGLTASHH
jgi:FtsP/CotA-like multicopper oxidase with cupredoxin domain